MNYNQEDENKSLFFIDEIQDRQHSGWLEGITQDDIIVPLCYKTEVLLLDEDKNSQRIKVNEGGHKNITLTIPYKYKDKDAVVSFLSKKRNGGKTILSLNTKTKTLDINKVGIFHVEISPSIKCGNYLLQIPVRPIAKTFNPDYYNEKIGGSRFMNTWFRLIPEKGILENVFLHYGSYSEGCITVINDKEFSVWNKIYLALIQSRLDKNHVGSLTVY